MNATDKSDAQPQGMSAALARRIEFTIIGLCLLALIMVFQPFSITLYGIGAVAVVVGGLAFNLVPLCRPGKPVKALVRAGLIVLTVLLVVVALAFAVTQLYILYLAASR